MNIELYECTMYVHITYVQDNSRRVVLGFALLYVTKGPPQSFSFKYGLLFVHNKRGYVLEQLDMSEFLHFAFFSYIPNVDNLNYQHFQRTIRGISIFPRKCFKNIFTYLNYFIFSNSLVLSEHILKIKSFKKIAALLLQNISD